MRNMGNIVGDADSLRAEREARNNPPEYEAGQGDDTDWSFLEDEGEDSYMDNDSYTGFEDSMLGDSSFSNNSFNMNQNQQVNQQKSEEDRMFDAIASAFKYSTSFIKDIYSGIREGISASDVFMWGRFSLKVLKVSSIVSIVGLVLWFLSLFWGRLAGFKWVMIGGLLSLSVAFPTWGICLSKMREAKEKFDNGEYEDGNEIELSASENISEDKEFSEDSGDWDWGDDDDEYEEYDYGDEDTNEESGNPWGDLEESFSSDYEEVENTTNIVEEVNIDDAISSIREIPANTQTRQYLFEEYSRVLPNITPSFSQLKPISENSDNFIFMDKILRDAAIQVGTKEEKLPDLLELRENQFIIQLKATRPTNIKEEEIAKEIANIYSRDEFGGIEYEGVYATTSSVGSSYIINLFKGEGGLVSLADTYGVEKDYILDTSVKKPVVLGVSELGRVWKCDAENIFSYIISGKPRSGKSWAGVSLVLQLCMYSSPKEVTFEALDVKDTTSDFYAMSKYLPHFKNFESNPQRILSRLRYLTTTEAVRRKKILDDNGVISVGDLRKKDPNIELPYCYVIIDELIGLKGKMTKDEDNEFKALVNTLVTEMPNRGFRVILVPHRVTNDVISKTTYTNVGCISCVGADFKEIESALETNKAGFPYTLCNTGDMALKTKEINKGKPVFSHGIAITKSNDTNIDIYKFVGSLWNKLEPAENNVNINEVSKSEYKGHNLTGIDTVDEEFIDGNNEEDDFWNSIL